MSATPSEPGAQPYRRPPFHKTLSFRLTIIYSAFVAIVVLGFYIFLYRQHTNHALHLIDAQLRRTSDLVRRSAIESLPEQSDLMIRLVDARGGVRAASRALLDGAGTPRPLPLPAGFEARDVGRGKTVEVDWHPYPLRMASFLVSSEGGPLWLQIAFPLDSLEATLSRFKTALFVVFPIVLVFTILSGLSIAKKALSPIVDITQSARRITVEKLSDRLSVSDVGDELDFLSETLNDMISRLEASFERTRRFTADASHELRTPLTAIRGETEMALRAPRGPEEYREVLVSNLEEVERLSSIVADLLVLSRSELRSDLKLQQLDLGELLAEIGSHLELLAQDKGLSLEWGTLPPVEMLGDRARLMQLFSNLLDNAVKYTPPGGTVRLELEADDVAATVRIRDTGIGIPADDLPHVFDRFFRVDRARSGNDTSTGLGLSICKWIVGSHNGTITVESSEGAGSTFIVRFPRGQPMVDGER